MSYPVHSVVVLDIAGKYARVFCNDPMKELTLSEAGFVKEGSQLVMPIADDNQRKALILTIANLGGIFSAGKDWSPAELVAFYREQGLPLESYKVISWRGPDDFVITTQ
jgi:hypothetical protein